MRLYFSLLQRKEVLEYVLSRGHPWIKMDFASYIPGHESLIDLAIEQGARLLIDSGAFTFHVKAENNPEWRRGMDSQVEAFRMFRPEIEEHLDRYLAFLSRYAGKLEAFLELDVGGPEGKTLLREKLEVAGFQPMPVLHSGDGWEYTRTILEKYPYVAVGGIAEAEGISEVRKRVTRILSFVKEKGTKLHGLGCTQQDVMQAVPFFSVDSTSWAAGQMYGQTFCFEKGRLAVVEKGDRKRYRRELAKTGMSDEEFQSFVEDTDPILATKWNLTQWAALAQYLGKYWAKRKPYWLKDEPQGQVYDVLAECTCGVGRGNCRRHGKGDHGQIVPVATMTPEVRKKISDSHRLMKAAMTTGQAAHMGPQLECGSCYLGDRCKKYEESAICACDVEFSALSRILGTRDFHSILEAMWRKIETDAVRLQRAIYFEAVDGGALDRSVENLSSSLTRDLAVLARMERMRGPQRPVDARQLNIRVEQLTESQFGQLLAAAADQRSEMPWLLEGGKVIESVPASVPEEAIPD